ncbi:MAG: hypothetical protein WAY38_04675, partial [Gemmiger qucibialis]
AQGLPKYLLVCYDINITRFSAKCPCLHGKILIRWESRKKQKNGLFLQRGGLFEFPVSPKWMYNRKESL